MTTARLTSRIRSTPAALFAFHCDPDNLLRISPPLPRVHIERANNPTHEGDLQQLSLRLGRWAVPWDARVTELTEPSLIVDVQERGPFRSWRHRHRFSAEGDRCRLTDEISFRLWPTVAGEFAEFWLVRPALLGMLWWRHRQTRRLVEARH